VVGRDYYRNIIQQSLRRIDPSLVKEKLQFYFGDDEGQPVHWQEVAAAAALLKKLLIITGSPGTGKTTAITKIMFMLQDLSEKPLRIALAAPTGKAAARLQEIVNQCKESLIGSQNLKERIPASAQTIHRLLGYRRDSPYFRFNEKNPLPYDLVIVDEASMVDLPLMAKLVTALPEDAAFILLGDKDQLASVEVGIVFGDLCALSDENNFSLRFAEDILSLSDQWVEGNDNPTGIQDHIVHLQKNYRFSDSGGMDVFSQAVRKGRVEEVLRLLRENTFADIQWINLAEEKNWLKKFDESILKDYQTYWKTVFSNPSDYGDIFELFEKSRVLCALRVGNWGTERINMIMEDIFKKAHWIPERSIFYEGMPVMILQNDYRLRLFNGDVGIALKDSDHENKIMIFFRDEQGKIRKFSPSGLPRHELAWAMTVHKSQGSEFEKVTLIFGDRDFPLITRELIYTGITRTRRQIAIWGGVDVLQNGVLRRLSRHSGLADYFLEQ
jgi:exodeoxyribonuclease V alpha subunit